ncbi:flagellar basal body-associated protein [Shewanella psychrophila]|uniref:Flagellar protein FliL n=1 Tax=Shewanella psychrophila TaxID=225848 RepID=A0A1S6HIH1_9GAMM|nr:flagellar basal body-associated FliL family protein [Shewanella psychrophila]AQS35312.1 flagellar basal body-associated protein [Shewanella psychrophila]
MAFGKTSVSKKLSFSLLIILWSTTIFWVGWQSPSIIGGPFVTQDEEANKAKFYPLDRFVISVPGDNLPHYLLLEMALKSRSTNVSRILKEADPLVRNSLMKMFSRKHFNQLNDSKQLENLQREALVLLSNVLTENKYEIEIDEVLFTRMVIQ